MDNLPPEVVTRILDLVDSDTRRNIRLVCKPLSSITTELVFREIHTACFQSYQNRLDSLSSSNLAKHVRKLVIHTSVLAGKKKDWEKTIQLRFWASWLSNYTVRKAAWLVIRRIVEQKQSWVKAAQGGAFAKTVARLPNLDEVVQVTEVALGEYRIWRLGVDALVAPLVEIWDRLEPGEEDHTTTQLILQAVGLRNNSQICRPIRGLSLTLDTDGKVSFRKGLGAAVKLQTAFTSLRNLDITLHTGDDPLEKRKGWPEARTPLENELNAILPLLKCLESLALECCGLDEEMYEAHERSAGCRLQIFNQTDGPYYPALETLSLGLSMPDKCLVALLKRHAKTLKSLELKHTFIRDPEHVLKLIPTILKLKQVNVENIASMLDTGICRSMPLGTRNHEPEMREFLLGKRDTMPHMKQVPVELDDELSNGEDDVDLAEFTGNLP